MLLKNKRVLSRRFFNSSFQTRSYGRQESYEEHRRLSLDPNMREQFWDHQAQQIHWFKKYDKILDSSKAPLYRWFSGGLTNVSYNCIDRHVVAGRGDDIAVIYESAFTKRSRVLTYSELQSQVARFSRVLSDQGVKKGDTVVIYMPMIPEALIAMHACVRLGAIHSVVFGGFAPEELANRIQSCKPKILVTASAGLEPQRIIPYSETVDRACQMAGVPEIKRVIVQRRSYREKDINKNLYIDYNEAIEKVNEGHDVVPVEGTHPFFVLYTSGTTGSPKGIYRSHGGQLAAYNYALNYIFDLGPRDVMFASSDIGWIVGHNFIIYGPLVRGGTTIMYEGKPVGTPNAGVAWRIIEDYKVKSFFIAPTGVRAIKKEDLEGDLLKQHDISSLKSVHLAGERCDPETVRWLQKQLPGVHINDNWWQTETGWPMCSNYINLTTFPTKPGSATKPCPGWDIKIMNDEDQVVEEPNKEGKIVVRLPCPPGHMDGLWGNDQAYVEKYLSSPEGWYLTGDAGVMDQDGYLYVLTRTDDVINTAGHRISTGRIEEVLSDLKGIAECAVVGKEDKLKGEVPVAFVILQNDRDDQSQILKMLQDEVRRKVGAFAKLEQVVFIQKLPKTRSGKILRNLLRDISNGVQQPRVTPTIEDMSVIPDITKAFLSQA